VVRTLDPHRLVEALFGYLGSHLDTADLRHLLLNAMALVGDAGAVLVPAEVRYLMPTLERRLHAKGVRVVDRPFVELDMDAMEVVVDEPGIDIDRSALRSLYGAIPGSRRADPPVSSGRYRLTGWAFGVDCDRTEQISSGEAVTLGCRQILRSAQLGPQPTLDGLAVAVRSVRRAVLWMDTREDLVGSLVALTSLTEPVPARHFRPARHHP